MLFTETVADFYALSQSWEKWLLASSSLSVCLSVRIEQLSSYWADFYEFWCLGTFQKSVEKISLIKISHDKRALYMNTYVHLW